MKPMKLSEFSFLKGYTGRNPKTGEKAFVPPKRLPFFKCGKKLKERVDYKSK